MWASLRFTVFLPQPLDPWDYRPEHHAWLQKRYCHEGISHREVTLGTLFISQHFILFLRES